MAQSVPFSDFRIAGLTSPEGKTIRFMRDLGFTRYDVYGVFLSLTCQDYVMGPLADDKGKRFDLWVFGKYVETFEAYIKFAAFFKGGRMRCLCVSFHELSTSCSIHTERQHDESREGRKYVLH